MIRDLFPSRRRKSGVPGKQRHRRGERLDFQSLEERIALAVDVFQYPISAVTSGSSSYAVLLMDDGSQGFLKKNASPTPTFTYADNSQFIDNPATSATAITFLELPSTFGPMQTLYVTSGARQRYAGSPIPATTLGKATDIQNTGGIDLGTSDGIVPGTFSGTVLVTDSSGNTGVLGIANTRPGERWNLSIELLAGDCALPTEGNINVFTGDIILRGWSDAPLRVELSPTTWGVFTDEVSSPGSLSFTLSPGQTVPQRFLVDLSRNESTITLNSPLTASLGNSGDPRFFAAAAGVTGQVGQVVLDGSTIVTNANVSSSSLFTVGVPMWVNFASPRIPVDTVSINRPVSAPNHQLIVEGAVGAPGQLLVGESGAIANSLTTPASSAAQVLDIQAIHTDVIFAGTVNSAQQTYLMQSPLDPRAYTLTTVSPTSGVQTGRILGNTVGVTLGNDAGGEVNVRTTIANLRMTAASTPSEPALPYAITVAESGDLTVDAVPASRRPIAIDAAGSLTTLSSVLTSGDVTLAATTGLTLAGAVSSAAGNVSLRSNQLTATVPLTAGGTRSVSLQSRDAAGDVVVNGLVRAGGQAKTPVRAATTADVNLAAGGLLTVDGVALAAGDRVLVKNQATPAQNGIYVAALGSWSRAADANTSQLLVAGFTVAVREGVQQGAWTFANPANPTLEQTGLLFVPASAVQTYVPARVATTANVNLAIGGLLTVDGVALAAGDRVLVRNQSNPRQNGLYVAGPGAWVRAADADTTAELRAGSYVFVAEGSAGQKGYVLTDDAVQVGNTPLTFAPFAVQPTRTNTYSPARVQTSVVAATTVHVDLAAPPAEIDGVTLVAGDLVLVKNQFDAATNGIYVFNGGSLQRWSGADSSSELPRGTMVYVDQGATNASTSWTLNDGVDYLGQTTAGSLLITGLPSTLYLASGMLVTGTGIPSDTKIDLILDSTTVRLTKSAVVSSTTAVLNFMQTSAVAVGTTPILFVPTGGTVAVTAGRSISSSSASPSSRITGSTAVLTASRPVTGTANTASLIDVNSAVGRLTAIAPGSVGVSDSGAIDLFDVRTLVGGAVAVDAVGTISARSVLAIGTTSAPANVTLDSALGDVVVATVNSTVGSIGLTSANERVIVRKLGLNNASVVAQDGDVTAVADKGDIRLEGPVTAGGTDGDITLRSDQAGLTMVAPASLTATDRLTVTTPNAIPSLGTGVTVSAKALSLTSQLGAAQSLPAGFGTFSTINLNRTDPGNIAFTSPTALTVEAATAVAGDITLTAPSLDVIGGVTAGGSAPGDGSIKLVSTAGNINLAAPVTAGGDRVTLDASAGVINQTAGQIDSSVLVWFATKTPLPALNGTYTITGPNLTAPGDLSISSLANPLVVAGASTVNGNIVVSAPSIRIIDVVKTGSPGNAVTMTASSGGIAFNVPNKRGIVSPSGSVTLSAASGSVTSSKGTNPDVAGGQLTINALSADLKTSVSSVAAAVTSGPLTLNGTGALTLGAISAPGQPVTLSAVSGVTQPTGGIVADSLAVTNGSGPVSLTASSNSVSRVSILNGTGNVSFVNAGKFRVMASGVKAGGSLPGDGNVSLKALGGDIVVNGVVEAQKDRVTLDASAGLIWQINGGSVNSQTLVWYATSQPSPSLPGTYNDIGANLTGPGSLTLNVLPTQNVLATSTVNGNIAITGTKVMIQESVTAGGAGSGISVSATGGDVTLDSVLGSAPALRAPNGLVSLAASGQVDLGRGAVAAQNVAISSGGTVLVGSVVASGTMTVATTNAGGVSVGPQTASLLQAGGALDLRSVQGPITISNGGRIIGNPLLLAPGQTIQFVGAITTAADLNSVVNAVNQLPAVAGATYDILVGASMTLTQTLTVNRPVTFRGTSSSIVLSGSPSVTNGLVFTSGAAGSTIRDIAFSSFSGNAIRAQSVSGLTVSGVTVRNSGTGIHLTNVTSSTIGGGLPGQGNVLSNCSREGIYATGICTNTRLVKNTFPGTGTAYNVSSSRGISVVN